MVLVVTHPKLAAPELAAPAFDPRFSHSGDNESQLGVPWVQNYVKMIYIRKFASEAHLQLSKKTTNPIP